MRSLLDETDNLADWHLQSIPQIQPIFKMSFQESSDDKNEWNISLSCLIRSKAFFRSEIETKTNPISVKRNGEDEIWIIFLNSDTYDVF